MPMARGAKIGIAVGLLGGLLGVAVGPVMCYVNRPGPAKESLRVRLDRAGPYLILATTRAAKDYAAAIAKAKALHPDAERVDFDSSDLSDIAKALRERQPRYALVFIEPDELDVNFAWRWVTMASQLDDDPFVDVRTGFITGASAEAAEAFVGRIAAAADGRLQLPGAFIDDAGPPERGDQQYFNMSGGSMFVPVLQERFSARSLWHGKGSFTDGRLGSLDGAGLLHFGGHGHPDRIDDGLTAEQIPKLKLAPCVVFSGACYTGVTRRWFDGSGARLVESAAAPDRCFCLNLLRKDVVAYLAAVHPDHGMPVYQEMEYLAFRGAPLGDVIKHTHDGVVIGAGGKMPAFEQLADGMARPNWTPADVMLKGTAARILFGDPSLVACEAFTRPPFTTTVEAEGRALRVTATLANPALKSTFTDTYRNDLNPQAPYNDRALLVVDLPPEWQAVEAVEEIRVRAGGKALPHRLVGYALERDQGERRLHVQVDLPAQGFYQSGLRVAGATVQFVARRRE